MSAEQVKSLTLEQEPGFPRPIEDRLGLARDPVYLSSRKTSEGREYVLVHSRPFLGEPMFAFINSVAPYRDDTGGYVRKMYDTLVHPTPKSKRRKPERGEPEEDFEDRLQRLHRGVDVGGVGLAFSQFVAKVGKEWTEALDDPTFDSVYTPLRGMLVYDDFSKKAEERLKNWREQLAGHRPPNPFGLIDKFTPYLQNNPLEDLRVRFYLRELDFDQVSKMVKEYVDNLQGEEAVNLVGNVLSTWEHEGLGYLLENRLVVDLKGKRFWHQRPHGYDMERGRAREGFVYEEPVVEFPGNRSLTLSDPINDVQVLLKFTDGESPSSPLPWKITAHTLPERAYSNGRYAAVAWRENNDGSREFLGHSQTNAAVEEAGIPILGVPDSYLGKLLIKYFQTEQGEYVQSEGEDKWLDRMGLPDSDKTRPITDRELPVWIQLPQHQQDLLGSNFINAAQRLAV